MERVSFDIERQEIADALHAEADARGHTVQAELSALVERVYGRTAPAATEAEADWVAELIDIARQLDLDDGIEPYMPPRIAEGYMPVQF